MSDPVIEAAKIKRSGTIIAAIITVIATWVFSTSGTESAESSSDNTNSISVAWSSDVNVLYEMGANYYFGRKGMPQDYAKALELFEKAAQQGHFKAQYNLGVMYRYGQGIPPNLIIAFRYYEKAAQQGYDKAQTSLGTMYCKGEGIHKNLILAKQWLEKAAQQGNKNAKSQLNGCR